jgi:hypothetical protein
MEKEHVMSTVSQQTDDTLAGLPQPDSEEQ